MAITSIKTGSSFTNLVKYNDFLAGNTAFSPSSYESIASATGTGSSGTITFSSIPSTYTSLQVRFMAKSTFGSDNANQVRVRFNGDTAANYTYHNVYGDGSAAYAEGAASQTYSQLRFLAPSTSANLLGVGIMDVQQYANTSNYKTLRYFGGTDTNGNTSIVSPVILGSGLWMSTSAITSISFICSTLNFTTDTTFALYGLRG
jgi:hypothetical protein